MGGTVRQGKRAGARWQKGQAKGLGLFPVGSRAPWEVESISGQFCGLHGGRLWGLQGQSGQHSLAPALHSK